MRPRLRAAVLDCPALTPLDAFEAAVGDGEGCLLESAASGCSPRYSLIGFNYLHSRTFADADSFYADVRACIAGLGSKPLLNPGFPGGVVFACGYDAARASARLKARIDGPAIAYVAVPGTWIVFDHDAHELTLVDRTGSSSVTRDMTRRLRAFRPRRMAQRSVGARATDIRVSLQETEFLEAAAAIKQHIVDGDVYQLQLGIRFDASYGGSAPDLYAFLRARNPSPYMYLLRTPFGVMVGTSPESLVRLRARQAVIRPLAGTRPRGGDEAQDRALALELLADEKERAEHVMLVDLARNDLGAVCEYGSVQVTELMQIERFSHVMHIVSNVAGTLRRELGAVDLFRTSFPAGTVTGTPKIRAIQLIDRFEPVPRGFYAGSVGLFRFDGDLDCCIALRGAQILGDRIFWQASAGIVADSLPAREYAEVLHKTAVLREALAIA